MNRVLLVDDSPHAQRIGERILSEEGFEVVTVSNADTAFVRLEDVDPEVVIADTVMPGRTGYEICQYIKLNPRFQHVRVLLTAGVLEPIDEGQATKVQADGTLKKPFEASMLVAAVRPLVEAARLDRERLQTGAKPEPKAAAPAAPAPFVAVVEPEQVRAAVTIALDASMETMVEEITRRVMAALQAKPATAKAEVQAPSPAIALPRPAAPIPPETKPEARSAPAPAAPAPAPGAPAPAPAAPAPAPVAPAPAPAAPAPAPVNPAPAPAAPAPAPVNPAPTPAAPAPATAPPVAPAIATALPSAAPPPSLSPSSPAPTPIRPEPVRRVHPLRHRSSTSILGLDPLPSDPESPPPDTRS